MFCFSRLKAVSSSAPVPEEVFSHRKSLLDVIIDDVCNQPQLSSCALQALGYILFNEHLAK